MVRRGRGGWAAPELAGIDINAWDELHHVFGGGEDYNWALELDDEEEQEDYLKQDMKYQDIFETSEIQRRFLTDDDELVRARDIPERMQLASSSLSQSFSLALYGAMNEEDPGGAAIIYHRARAAEEFGSLSLNAKYCVGLARYIQSPLNDFAALGSDITAIAFEEERPALGPEGEIGTGV
ncbi:hypothetical protein BKA70DRAFT_1426581 [Coprinopsis sp. MPI-PUGE-AT-0042]|nr:hypothetical protein BKA70DRAFT_1426581 [Coprinopsis sp. MPI-PUGE-AT-0042]